MIYCTSDLHGIALSDFKALLKKADFRDGDFLFVLGDVIDRGEHGIELLEWFSYQPNIQLILGNHEAMMLSCKFLFDEITYETVNSMDNKKINLLSQWMSNGAEPTLKALQKLNAQDSDACQSIIEYVEEAPLYETVSAGGRDFLLCHAGFEDFDKDKRLSEYPADQWIWSRPRLHHRFYQNTVTVFGHTPTRVYGEEYDGKTIKTDTWINIDTSPKPCLLRLDDLAEIYM